MNDAVKIAKISHKEAVQQQTLSLVKEIVSKPLVQGFGALLVNHAIYKAGWYDSKTSIKVPSAGFLAGIFGGTTTITPEQAAANMHDSIATFIMLCAAAEAVAPLIPTITAGGTRLLSAAGLAL